MLLIFMCFNELNLFMQRRLFVYLLMVVSCFLFYKASILKKEFDFFNKKLKLTSHCVLHYLSSVDLLKNFSQLIVTIFIFSQKFSQFFQGKKVQRYSILLISRFIDFKEYQNIQKQYVQFKYTFLDKVFHYRIVSARLLSSGFSSNFKTFLVENKNTEDTLMSQKQSLQVEVSLFNIAVTLAIRSIQ